MTMPKFDDLMQDEKYKKEIYLRALDKFKNDFKHLTSDTAEQEWHALSEETREHYKFLGEQQLSAEMLEKATQDPEYMEQIKQEAFALRGNTPDELIFTLNDGTEVFRIFRNKDHKIDLHISASGQDKYTQAVKTFMNILLTQSLRRNNFTLASAMQYMKQGYKVARHKDNIPYLLKDNKLHYVDLDIVCETKVMPADWLLADDFYVYLTKEEKKNLFVQ